MAEARLWVAARTPRGRFGYLRAFLARARSKLDPVVLAVVALLVVVAPICAWLVANDYGIIAIGVAGAIPVGMALLVWPFLGIVVWLLLMPYFMGDSTPVNIMVLWLAHRLLIPAMLLLVAIYHFTGLRRSPFRLAWFDFALMAFIFLGAVNVGLLAEGGTQRMAVAFHQTLVVPIMLFWLVRAVGLERREIGALVFVGFVTLTMQSLIGVTSWFVPGALPADWLGRAGERTVGSLGGPAPFTVTIVFFAFLLLHNLRDGQARWYRAATLILFAVGIGLVFLSLSRGSWFGAGAALAGLTVLYPRLMIRAVPILAVGALAIALSPLGQQLTVAQERIGEVDTVASRQSTNDAAVQMIAQRPLLGFGYGNFEIYDESFKRRLGDAGLRLGGSAHHTYLALAAENGLPALILYMTPVVGLAYRSLTRWRSLPQGGGLDRALLVILWLALLDQFVVSNFMDMLHSSPWGTGIWWLTLGIIAVMVGPQRPWAWQRPGDS